MLVTSASGTIGRRLVPALVAAGYQVRAMTRSDAAAQAAAEAGEEPVHGDVTDPASLSAAVRGCQVVIHAAGRMGASPAVEPFWACNPRKKPAGHFQPRPLTDHRPSSRSLQIVLSGARIGATREVRSRRITAVPAP